MKLLEVSESLARVGGLGLGDWRNLCSRCIIKARTTGERETIVTAILTLGERGRVHKIADGTRIEQIIVIHMTNLTTRGCAVRRRWTRRLINRGRAARSSGLVYLQ